MNIIAQIFDMIWAMLKYVLFALGVVIVPIVIVGVIYLLYRVIIKKDKIPRKKKPEVVKYTKKGLFRLLKKIYINFPVRFVKDRLEGDPDQFTVTGVHIFAGEQGSGKSIACVHFVRMLKERFPLIKIRSNIDLDISEGLLKDANYLIFNDNGIFGQVEFIDEFQNWFNSLESKNFPPEMLQEITQQRKQKKCIVGTSQVFERLAKPIREQITLLYKPMTIAGCFTIVRVYKVKINDSGLVDKMQMRKLYCFVHDDELRNAYDTYAKVKRQSLGGFKPNSEQIRTGEPIITMDKKGKVLK
jgi:hypothetical protein